MRHVTSFLLPQPVPVKESKNESASQRARRWLTGAASSVKQQLGRTSREPSSGYRHRRFKANGDYDCHWALRETWTDRDNSSCDPRSSSSQNLSDVTPRAPSEEDVVLDEFEPSIDDGSKYVKGVVDWLEQSIQEVQRREEACEQQSQRLAALRARLPADPGKAAAVSPGLLGDDRPGAYLVVRPAALSAEAWDVSTATAMLHVGMRVNVTDIVVIADGRRVRGRIESPEGWMSLVDPVDGFRWAEPLLPCSSVSAPSCTILRKPGALLPPAPSPAPGAPPSLPRSLAALPLPPMPSAAALGGAPCLEAGLGSSAAYDGVAVATAGEMSSLDMMTDGALSPGLRKQITSIQDLLGRLGRSSIECSLEQKGDGVHGRCSPLSVRTASFGSLPSRGPVPPLNVVTGPSHLAEQRSTLHAAPGGSAAVPFSPKELLQQMQQHRQQQQQQQYFPPQTTAVLFSQLRQQGRSGLEPAGREAATFQALQRKLEALAGRLQGASTAEPLCPPVEPEREPGNSPAVGSHLNLAAARRSPSCQSSVSHVLWNMVKQLDGEDAVPPEMAKALDVEGQAALVIQSRLRGMMVQREAVWRQQRQRKRLQRQRPAAAKARAAVRRRIRSDEDARSPADERSLLVGAKSDYSHGSETTHGRSLPAAPLPSDAEGRARKPKPRMRRAKTKAKEVLPDEKAQRDSLSEVPREFRASFSLENLELARLTASQKAAIKSSAMRHLARVAGVPTDCITIFLSKGSVKVSAWLSIPAGFEIAVTPSEDKMHIMAAKVAKDVSMLPDITGAKKTQSQGVVVKLPSVVGIASRQEDHHGCRLLKSIVALQAHQRRRAAGKVVAARRGKRLVKTTTSQPPCLAEHGDGHHGRSVIKTTQTTQACLAESRDGHHGRSVVVQAPQPPTRVKAATRIQKFIRRRSAHVTLKNGAETSAGQREKEQRHERALEQLKVRPRACTAPVQHERSDPCSEVAATRSVYDGTATLDAAALALSAPGPPFCTLEAPVAAEPPGSVGTPPSDTKPSVSPSAGPVRRTSSGHVEAAKQTPAATLSVADFSKTAPAVLEWPGEVKERRRNDQDQHAQAGAGGRRASEKRAVSAHQVGGRHHHRHEEPIAARFHRSRTSIESSSIASTPMVAATAADAESSSGASPREERGARYQRGMSSPEGAASEESWQMQAQASERSRTRRGGLLLMARRSSNSKSRSPGPKQKEERRSGSSHASTSVGHHHSRRSSREPIDSAADLEHAGVSATSTQKSYAGTATDLRPGEALTDTSGGEDDISPLRKRRQPVGGLKGHAQKDPEPEETSLQDGRQTRATSEQRGEQHREAAAEDGQDALPMPSSASQGHAAAKKEVHDVDAAGSLRRNGSASPPLVLPGDAAKTAISETTAAIAPQSHQSQSPPRRSSKQPSALARSKTAAAGVGMEEDDVGSKPPRARLNRAVTFDFAQQASEVSARERSKSRESQVRARERAETVTEAELPAMSRVHSRRGGQIMGLQSSSSSPPGPAVLSAAESLVKEDPADSTHKEEWAAQQQLSRDRSGSGDHLIGGRTTAGQEATSAPGAQAPEVPEDGFEMEDEYGDARSTPGAADQRTDSSASAVAPSMSRSQSRRAGMVLPLTSTDKTEVSATVEEQPHQQSAQIRTATSAAEQMPESTSSTVGPTMSRTQSRREAVVVRPLTSTAKTAVAASDEEHGADAPREPPTAPTEQESKQSSKQSSKESVADRPDALQAEKRGSEVQIQQSKAALHIQRHYRGSHARRKLVKHHAKAVAGRPVQEAGSASDVAPAAESVLHKPGDALETAQRQTSDPSALPMDVPLMPSIQPQLGSGMPPEEANMVARQASEEDMHAGVSKDSEEGDCVSEMAPPSEVTAMSMDLAASSNEPAAADDLRSRAESDTSAATGQQSRTSFFSFGMQRLNSAPLAGEADKGSPKTGRSFFTRLGSAGGGGGSGGSSPAVPMPETPSKPQGRFQRASTALLGAVSAKGRNEGPQIGRTNTDPTLGTYAAEEGEVTPKPKKASETSSASSTPRSMFGGSDKAAFAPANEVRSSPSRPAAAPTPKAEPAAPQHSSSGRLTSTLSSTGSVQRQPAGFAGMGSSSSSLSEGDLSSFADSDSDFGSGPLPMPAASQATE
eukprot:TRINITY_DN15216_c0_g2_i4.p1 TRINITY_DN15216_c0_g2~~TRINITY_DN15216_c0_g2_i4.p1  ORF type:complete len:2133 (-),score=418.19 TRINITY_DN15216_c0_g2_i4:176-6574(-)